MKIDTTKLKNITTKTEATITNILKGGWNILNSKVFLYAMITFFVLFGLRKCGNEKELEILNSKLEQNYTAAKDSVRYLETSKGGWQAEKEIFILSEKELKKENSDLYKSIKEQDGNIISLNKTNIILKQGKDLLQDSINYLTSYIDSAYQIDSNTWEIPWRLEYNWSKTSYDIFEGKTFVSVDSKEPLLLTHKNTMLYNRETQIDFEFGNKVVDGKYNVYIKTTYPGFSTDDLTGVFIDPNTNKDIKSLMVKDHWFTGLSFGLSATLGMDLWSGNPGLVVGPSMTYNIYSW